MSGIAVNKLKTLTGHRDCVYNVVSGKSNNDIFSASGDGMIAHWDLNNPEEGEVVAKLSNSIYSIHYLRDQDLLVGGQNYEGIHLLDYKNRREIKSMQLTKKAIFDMASFADKLLVATGEGHVHVVDLTSWEVIHKMDYTSHSARCIAVNYEMSEFAVGYSDHKIRIFSLVDFSLKTTLEGHTGSVFTLMYAPQGNYLISGSRDAHLKIWDTTASYQLDEDIVAHLYTINHIAFSPDCKHFVTCSMDKSIKVWSWPERRLIKVIDKARHAGHGTSVNKLTWTAFNNQVVSASDDKTLCVWDLIF